MASDWKTLTVDQIRGNDDRAIAIGPFGSRMKATAYVEAGVPVIRGNNISDTRAFIDDFVFVSEATADELRSCNVFRGDLVFPHRGAIGKVGIISEGDAQRYMLSTSLMKLTCNRTIVEPQFIFYFFRSPLGRHALLENASTVGTPGIGQPLASLRSIRVPVPPLPEQRKIAHILGTLDAKIELNHRMSETLEAMARALFKSWFVDFDPVRAKVEGHEVVNPRQLADLFPATLESIESAKAPKGWGVSHLDSCIDVARGLSYKGSGLADAGMPMHNLNSIFEGGGYKHDGIKHYDGEYKPNHILRAGDLIVANTEQGHDRLLIGYAAIVPERFGSESLFSHHLYRVRPKVGCHLTVEYLCHLLNSDSMHDSVSGYANGTTVNMLSMDGLKLPEILVPPKGLVDEFTRFAASIRRRREEIFEENRTLAKLRDALLPKLISGELRVPEPLNFAGGHPV